jgi:hypothetical protein
MLKLSKNPTQEELIKAEIERLHYHNRGDAAVSELIKQIAKNYKPIVFNPLQMTMRLMRQMGVKDLTVEAGRGAGKSTAIADWSADVVYNMPRSNNLLIGETYQQILTRTLPSTILGWENLGLFQGLHYFVGRKAPEKWKWLMPYQPPKNFENAIHFHNGSIFALISQDKSNDGRGLNSDSQIKDEAGILDRHKLEQNTDPTQRGSNIRLFEKSRMFLSDLSVSTTPLTIKGNWFIEKEEYCQRHPNKAMFLKATCEVNAKNLPTDYLSKARAKNLEWIFNAEYLNIRPKQIKGGFYPLLDDSKHTYNNFNYAYYQRVGQAIDCRGDGDLVAGKSLNLSIDWGAVINCLVVCQHLTQEYRALKSMYVLGDDKKIQDDLFRDFDDYYKYHKPSNNTIYLWYDNTGNNDTGVTKYTRAQQAQRQLTTLGWKVILKTVGGANPQHGKKHILWNEILKEKDTRLPKFRMNRANCKELWISMFNAKAIDDGKGNIKKDKRVESNEKIPREHATDLSDAMDTSVFGIFYHVMGGQIGTLPSISIKTN